jgi:predicted ABC-type ATPase
MHERLHGLTQARTEFGFESTLSSVTPVNFLRKLKAQGYPVLIFYFTLASTPACYTPCVVTRKLGSHSIPKDLIERRCGRSAANFLRLYIPLVNEWIIQNNIARSRPTEIAHGTVHETTIVLESKWQQLHQYAKHS